MKRYIYTVSDFLKKSKIVYSVIHSYRSFLAKKNFEKSLENFHKYGFEALSMFDKCMKENNFEYSLAFGTLLGAIREHDFIPHDDDIDVAMWIDDYSPDIIQKLNDYGINIVHSFTIDDDKIGKEDTFEYKSVLIDIFYFYKSSDGDVYCCDFINQPGCSNMEESIVKYGGLLPRKIIIPLKRDLVTVDFKGLQVSIPMNYKDILSYRYGIDYMTPKQSWRPATSHVVEMPEYLGILKKY